MTGGGPDSAGVRAHYAALARDYDRRANRACGRAYEDLIRRTFAGRRRVLEIGAGSSPRAGLAGAPRAVACDLSWPMLAARNALPDLPRAVADGAALPFATGAFDGVFSINVIEHVPDPAVFIAESARVLAPGGLLLIVTPNGDAARLLALLERLRLKLPEGPHRFLGARELAELSREAFDTLEHRKFLALPAGPPAFVRGIDALVRAGMGRGLFQYAVLRRR
ncbi:MAG: methyltransferase domain-containing protein [Candidatus Hydrogenedentes bacterium]|nr:methyltransferase domain-containing protein [Candidatus Hydrogenedentota bacterium]